MAAAAAAAGAGRSAPTGGATTSTSPMVTMSIAQYQALLLRASDAGPAVAGRKRARSPGGDDPRPADATRRRLAEIGSPRDAAAITAALKHLPAFTGAYAIDAVALFGADAGVTPDMSLRAACAMKLVSLCGELGDEGGRRALVDFTERAAASSAGFRVIRMSKARREAELWYAPGSHAAGAGATANVRTSADASSAVDAVVAGRGSGTGRTSSDGGGGTTGPAPHGGTVAGSAKDDPSPPPRPRPGEASVGVRGTCARGAATCARLPRRHPLPATRRRPLRAFAGTGTA